MSEISIFVTRNDWDKHTVSPMENVNQVCSTHSQSRIVPRSAEVFRRLVVYSTKEYSTNLQYIGMYSTDSYSTNIYTAHTYRYIQHIRTYKYVYTAHTYKYVYMSHTYKYMQYIRTYKYIQYIHVYSKNSLIGFHFPTDITATEFQLAANPLTTETQQNSYNIRCKQEICT